MMLAIRKHYREALALLGLIVLALAVAVYILASPDYSFIRSSGVKEIAAFGGDVSELVPASVAAALRERAKS